MKNMYNIVINKQKIVGEYLSNKSTAFELYKRIWSIDITYVTQGNNSKCYLFATKDFYDKLIIDLKR